MSNLTQSLTQEQILEALKQGSQEPSTPSAAELRELADDTKRAEKLMRPGAPEWTPDDIKFMRGQISRTLREM